MSLSNFIYRQKQKWKYHTTNSSFEKKVAEINRNHEIIFLKHTTFKIKGFELILSRQNHLFIVDRFDVFMELLMGRGRFSIDGGYLIYAIDDVRLRITTSEELFIIHEVYMEGCYAIKIKEDFFVIDIGMNVGFASLFFASNPSVIKVYGYELFKPTFDDAQMNFSLNPKLLSKIKSFSYGLGDGFQKRTLPYSSDWKGKNSMYNGENGNEEVEIKDAKEVIEEVISKNQRERFFIKIDCEGAEFEIFDSFQKDRIPDQIFGFIIEWHQKSPLPIVDILISNNFKVQLKGSDKIGIITAFR